MDFFDHNRQPFESIALDYGPQPEVMVNPFILTYDTVISLSQLKDHNRAEDCVAADAVGARMKAWLFFRYIIILVLICITDL
ncbi:MAG TPA: hypothetical protein DCS13_11330 [Candidatus Margulisbacteria bacterium]|nr:MAG: hypothetical protein A2X43_06530 [Candidatus Margulisbacteria bacterium GWD2_39_127]OGI05604.1 MAG: hypothetical protein A2X42_08910 [Candidatus Margulisbacteria bacterium GWF2_38_17]OGI07561.1 MAG: hypothetical protein A2X41_08815 [Candidatus Margulisbacteria bacterium GWE2_39_32]HAR64046.1 hypothetical protein [Candidatus Margulisiibacteriota bacterium]